MKKRIKFLHEKGSRPWPTKSIIPIKEVKSCGDLIFSREEEKGVVQSWEVKTQLCIDRVLATNGPVGGPNQLLWGVAFGKEGDIGCGCKKTLPIWSEFKIKTTTTIIII